MERQTPFQARPVCRPNSSRKEKIVQEGLREMRREGVDATHLDTDYKTMWLHSLCPARARILAKWLLPPSSLRDSKARQLVRRRAPRYGSRHHFLDQSYCVVSLTLSAVCSAA